jgi:nucleotide-binding universal stress UspA family protein
LLADLANVVEKITVLIEQGDPYNVILETARAQGCDLIVTGVARNQIFGRLTLGGGATAGAGRYARRRSGGIRNSRPRCLAACVHR